MSNSIIIRGMISKQSAAGEGVSICLDTKFLLTRCECYSKYFYRSPLRGRGYSRSRHTRLPVSLDSRKPTHASRIRRKSSDDRSYIRFPFLSLALSSARSLDRGCDQNFSRARWKVRNRPMPQDDAVAFIFAQTRARDVLPAPPP
jgi:hypothetical protein